MKPIDFVPIDMPRKPNRNRLTASEKEDRKKKRKEYMKEYNAKKARQKRESTDKENWENYPKAMSILRDYGKVIPEIEGIKKVIDSGTILTEKQSIKVINDYLRHFN